MFIIGCRVSGGVTGTRTSTLKKNGELLIFKTFEEAEAALPESRVTDRGVCFEYWVEGGSE